MPSVLKHPSLETRWLKHEKWISLPQIILATVEDCCGYYVRPDRREMLIDGRYFDCERGLIVYNEWEGSDYYEGVIAHEFRHHWQYLRGWKYDGVEWDLNRNYKEAIVNYFTHSRSEYDALMYEVTKAPDEVNEERYEWICRELSVCNTNG